MSTLKVNTIQDTSGNTQYTAKAWVNFNGTGTVAIRASGNVSSITDNTTGAYTVNFTNSMSDTNYATLATVKGVGSTGTTYNQSYANAAGHAGTYSTSAVMVNVFRTDPDQLIDGSYVMVAIFR